MKKTMAVWTVTMRVEAPMGEYGEDDVIDMITNAIDADGIVSGAFDVTNVRAERGEG
jgi:hypothetical protein